MYYVYILKSLKTKKYYIGQTNNIERRLIEHNSSKSKYTSSGVPWELVYNEECSTRSEAFRREQQIKRYKGGVAFRKLIG